MRGLDAEDYRILIFVATPGPDIAATEDEFLRLTAMHALGYVSIEVWSGDVQGRTMWGRKVTGVTDLGREAMRIYELTRPLHDSV
jgi:hypothetical protein